MKFKEFFPSMKKGDKVKVRCQRRGLSATLGLKKYGEKMLLSVDSGRVLCDQDVRDVLAEWGEADIQ